MRTITKLSGQIFAAAILTILASMATARPSMAQDCALERPLNTQRSTVLPNNKLFTINIGDTAMPVLMHWDNLPTTDTNPADGVPDVVTSILDQIETTMNAFDAAGFRQVQGVAKCGQSNVFTVFIYQRVGTNTPGGTALGPVFDFRFTQQDRTNGQIDVVSRNTIAHEIFHSIQFEYPISDFQKWLVEGTATLAPDLIDTELDASPIDSPAGVISSAATCEEQLLQTPGLSLVRRDSSFNDGSNACMSKLFWRYFTEQIGTNLSEPTRGIDALVDLFELTSNRPKGWRIRETDKLIGAGDFDGDGREELLIQSDTHIGLISMTFGRNRILNVTGVGARLGSRGWLLAASDVLSSIGDYNGDGKDEFVITSGSHIGFIGLDSRQRLRTLNSLLLGAGRFGGGWVPNSYDRRMGVADVDGDGLDELLLSNSQYVGLVGLTSRNETRSLAIRAKGGLDSETLRVLAASARVGDTGDLNGDGREEFTIKDLRGIYALGLSPDGNFRALAALDLRESVRDARGRTWRLRSDAGIRGVGPVIGPLFGGPAAARDEIVMQDGNSFAVLAVDTSGRFVLRRAYSVGANFGDGSTYGNGLEIVDVENMDDDSAAEIVIRQGNEVGILKWDPTSPALLQVASLTNANFGIAELSTARLGGGGAYVLSRSPAFWHTAAYHDTVPGLVQESTSTVGEYVDDLISRMDEMIRAKTGGSRDFNSLWRDFSIALYTKDLNVNSLETPYFFVDEQNDGYKYHYDPVSSGPPVRPVELIRWLSDTGRKKRKINRWSADYFRLAATLSGSQRVLVSVIPKRGEGRISATVVITEGNRLVRMDRDANPRGGVMARYYDLAPRQELGLIISAADEAPEYSYRIRSTSPD